MVAAALRAAFRGRTIEQWSALRAQRNTSLMLGVEKRFAHAPRGEGLISDLGFRISNFRCSGDQTYALFASQSLQWGHVCAPLL